MTRSKGAGVEVKMEGGLGGDGEAHLPCRFEKGFEMLKMVFRNRSGDKFGRPFTFSGQGRAEYDG